MTMRLGICGNLAQGAGVKAKVSRIGCATPLLKPTCGTAATSTPCPLILGDRSGVRTTEDYPRGMEVSTMWDVDQSAPKFLAGPSDGFLLRRCGLSMLRLRRKAFGE